MSEQQLPTHALVRYAVPLLILAVIVVGLPSRFFGEIIPFAPWDMFSKIPTKTTVHVLYVHKLGAVEYPEPVPAQLIPKLARTFRSPTTKTAVNKFGHAIASAKKGAPGQEELALTLRKSIEARLPSASVYEIRRLSGNPLEAHRTGKFEGERRIGLFRCGDKDLSEFRPAE